MTAPAIPPVSIELDATVLICTYNRPRYLGETLDSLSAMRIRPDLRWDVLVVDNNSTDDTRRVVESRQQTVPVRLRYLFEGRQGKSHALNTGMTVSPARFIVFTDDDVKVPSTWLDEAVAPMLRHADIDYTGGPVRPIWGGPRPAWLDEKGNLGGTIAVKDHGDAAFIFEAQRKTPLGVNMAVRRSLVERIGGFRPDLGRNGKSLLGQEQAEFFYRSRQSGARGMYVPTMILDHLVPAERLTRNYFRRWWYWKGVSHARLHRIHGETELGLRLETVPRIAGIPRFVFGTALHNAAGWVRDSLARDPARRAQHVMMLAYSAGYCREAGRRQKKGEATGFPPNRSDAGLATLLRRSP